MDPPQRGHVIQRFCRQSPLLWTIPLKLRRRTFSPAQAAVSTSATVFYSCAGGVIAPKMPVNRSAIATTLRDGGTRVGTMAGRDV